MKHLGEERVDAIRSEIEECLPDAYGPLRLLDRGGMSLIFVTEHRHLGTRIVKAYPQDSPHSDDVFLRARLEGRILARVQHPNIRQCFDFLEGQKEVRALAVLQYVEGTDLREWALGDRTEGERIRVLIQITRALAAAHDHKVLHRDIKPQNVLVDHSGHAFLCDFGIALDGEDTRVTRADNSAPLTLQYASPEQIEGKTLDARSDIYSLGVVFYEVLFGVRLRRGAKLDVTNATCPVELPERVQDLLERMLQDDREERPRSCREVLEVLADSDLDELSTEPLGIGNNLPRLRRLRTMVSPFSLTLASPRVAYVRLAAAILLLVVITASTVGLVWWSPDDRVDSGKPDFGTNRSADVPRVAPSTTGIEPVTDPQPIGCDPTLSPALDGSDSARASNNLTDEQIDPPARAAEPKGPNGSVASIEHESRPEESESQHCSREAAWSNPPSERTKLGSEQPEAPVRARKPMQYALITDFETSDPWFIPEPRIRVSRNDTVVLDTLWSPGLSIEATPGDRVVVEPLLPGWSFEPKTARLQVSTDRNLQCAFRMTEASSRKVGTPSPSNDLVESRR